MFSKFILAVFSVSIASQACPLPQVGTSMGLLRSTFTPACDPLGSAGTPHFLVPPTLKPYLQSYGKGSFGSAFIGRSETAYFVVAGDTGNAIAAQWSITFNTLDIANPSVQWQSLQIGQSLSIPSSRTPTKYAVASGDTGNAIALKYNIQFLDLEAANPDIVDWHGLQIDQTLQVPGYGTTTTYSAMSGDTGNSIAAQFNIAFTKLEVANPDVNWGTLQISEVLQIPSGQCPACQSTSAVPPTSTPIAAPSTPSALPSTPASARPSATTSASITTEGAPTTPSSSLIVATNSVPGPPAVSQSAGVNGPDAVSTITDDDGAGSLPDKYMFYNGDGSTWPETSAWETFSNMWANNQAIISCTGDIVSNSVAENSLIRGAIDAVAQKSQLDHRFILAFILQESKGCVRVNTTVSPPPDNIENPGIMQSYKGTGTCNTNSLVQSPCPAEMVFQMVEDGVFGTVAGQFKVGLVPTFNKAKGTGVQAFYQTARLYNSGSIPSDGNLSGPSPATPCYASDIANRLMGWVHAASQCTLTPSS